MLDHSQVDIPSRFKNHPLFNELHCGMNFGFMAGRGYYRRPEVLAQPALMAAAGVNWVTLNANFCQETFASRKVFLDFAYSSGEAELTDMARAMHDAGLRVLFKPCLTPLDGSWMGSVAFPEGRQINGVQSDYWREWFDSFIESSKYFAEFAERNRLEAMIIGAEYFGTEGRGAEWREVIAAIRAVYSGPLTYECTFKSLEDYELDWFDELDFLSYSYYPPACPVPDGKPAFADHPHYSVEQMVEFLSARRSKVERLSKRFGRKPVAFTEIGVRSAHGCISRPFDFLEKTGYDGREQADYMEAVFRTFWTVPQWLGLYWWKWDETQHRPHYFDEPGVDKGFTIQGKPAEAVMRRWFGRRGGGN